MPRKPRIKVFDPVAPLNRVDYKIIANYPDRPGTSNLSTRGELLDWLAFQLHDDRCMLALSIRDGEAEGVWVFRTLTEKHRRNMALLLDVDRATLRTIEELTASSELDTITALRTLRALAAAGVS